MCWRNGAYQGAPGWSSLRDRVWPGVCTERTFGNPVRTAITFKPLASVFSTGLSGRMSRVDEERVASAAEQTRSEQPRGVATWSVRMAARFAAIAPHLQVGATPLSAHTALLFDRALPDSSRAHWLPCARRPGDGSAPPESTRVRTHPPALSRSEEHTSELQSHLNLVCRLLLEKNKTRPASSGSSTMRRCSGAGLTSVPSRRRRRWTRCGWSLPATCCCVEARRRRPQSCRKRL